MKATNSASANMASSSTPSSAAPRSCGQPACCTRCCRSPRDDGWCWASTCSDLRSGLGAGILVALVFFGDAALRAFRSAAPLLGLADRIAALMIRRLRLVAAAAALARFFRLDILLCASFVVQVDRVVVAYV